MHRFLGVRTSGHGHQVLSPSWQSAKSSGLDTDTPRLPGARAPPTVVVVVDIERRELGQPFLEVADGIEL